MANATIASTACPTAAAAAPAECATGGATACSAPVFSGSGSEGAAAANVCDRPFCRGCLQWWPRLFAAWTATPAAKQLASNTFLALLALASHPYCGVRVMGGSACLPLLSGSLPRNPNM